MAEFPIYHFIPIIAFQCLTSTQVCDVLAVTPTTEWDTIRVVFRSHVAAESRDVRAIATLAYEMMGIICGHFALPPYFRRISFFFLVLV
jgi:hypothetical protein